MKKWVFLIACIALFISCGGGGQSSDIINTLEGGGEQEQAATGGDNNPDTPLPPPIVETAPEESSGVANVSTDDADADGIKDGVDNCQDIANSDQTNTDKDYAEQKIVLPQGGAVVGDEMGNACDDDIDNDGLHITYSDAQHGLDTNLGTFVAPVNSLKRAIELALDRGDDVYLSPGEYDISNTTFVDGVDIFGGYDNATGMRFAHNTTFKTTLVRSDSPVTLHIEDLSGQISFDGLYIENRGDDDTAFGVLPDSNEYGCLQASVYIANAKVNLFNSEMFGNSASEAPCGVLLGAGADVTLTANWVNASGKKNATQSIGISAVEANFIATNNIIIAGNGEHATGLKITNSTATVVNNTIDEISLADHPKTSYGLSFNGGESVIVNNIIFSGFATDQSALLCAGFDQSNSQLKNNILTTFPQGGISAILIDCDGTYIINEPNPSLSGTSVSGNLSFSGNLGALLDASYNLAGAIGVNIGLDTNAEIYGNVIRDFNNKPRVIGSYDIGAIEK